VIKRGIGKMSKSRFAVDLEKISKSLCKDCRAFIRKFKKWDERKVQKLAIMQETTCRKCKMGYRIYKRMIYAIPFMRSKKVKCNRCDKILDTSKAVPHDCVCENMREGSVVWMGSFSEVKE